MSKTGSPDAMRERLLRIFDEAFDKQAWHGPNLLGSVRRVPAAMAARRPGPGRHNIAEIIVHCAYWKYAIRRRILGGKRGSFALKGSNWFALPPGMTDRDWRDYLTLLREQHAALRKTLASTPWKAMVQAFGSEAKLLHQTFGIAMHDIYHAGQIQTIKALLKRSDATR